MNGQKKYNTINSLLVVSLLLLFGINQFILVKIFALTGNTKISGLTSFFGGGAKGGAQTQLALAGDPTQDAIKFVISQGVPEIYGTELGVSFDQVQASMNIMSLYDPEYGKQKIALTGDDLKRYIDIGLRISCEYCCGAKSIIFQNGRAACGCAHSQAMRGLAAYLLTKHGQEYSNDEILRELARWKGVYFPKQMIQKLAGHLQGSNFTPDTAALVMGVKLPNYGKGSSNAPIPSEIQNLPSMVGGC